MPKISDSGVELDALAKATPEEQVAAVEAVKTGQAKTIREVISQPKPVYTHGTEKPAPPTPRAKPTVREALAKGRYNKSPELLEWVRTYQRWPTKTKAKARELFLTITLSGVHLNVEGVPRRPAATKPAPILPIGQGTPREQWSEMTAAAYRAPTSDLHDALMDTARLINEAKHVDDISRPKRELLLRKFAAALGVPSLLKDPDPTLDPGALDGRLSTKMDRNEPGLAHHTHAAETHPQG